MVALPSAWTVFVLIAVGASYVVISSFLNYRKLPHIKGPLLAQIGPLWLLYHTLRGDLYLQLGPLLAKYGSPIRIAPDYIIDNDPENVRQMHSVRSPFVRGRWYDAMRLGADQDNVMTLVDEKAHSEQRAKLLPGYSGREVPGFEVTSDTCIVELVSTIKRDYVEKDLAFDFARLASFMTLDVVTKVAFDLELGYLRENKDHYDYNKTMAEFTPIMDLCCNHPTIFKILNSKLVMSVLKPKPEDKIGQGALIGHAHKAVAEHFKSNDKDESGSMVASWKRHGVTQSQCQDETMLLILAGSDSTSTALRMTFLHVLTLPRVYSALNKEIDAALERGEVSYPVIKLDEAKSLPYLSATIKEGLRIFGPLHGLGSQYSHESFEINGKVIPPKINIGFDWYGLPRSKKVFGPDAEEFRPERWIEADSETLKRYDRVGDLTFSSGKSMCLGKNLALMELHKAIFELFRNFDFDIANPLRPVWIGSNSIVTLKDMYVRARVKRAV